MNTLIMMIILSFVIGLVAGKILIPFLRGLHASQTEREELESHKKKEGTPTMGGLIFIIPIVVLFFVFLKYTKDSLPVLFLSLGFGVIGFLDDFLKVVLKRSDGLIAWQKFILQMIFCGGFLLWVSAFSKTNIGMFRIPFIDNQLELGIVGIPLLLIAIVGTVNGVNFTDGLDGLASSVTLVVCVFFGIASMLIGNDMMYLPTIVAGALMAFLVYNVYPAKTFMGDTGSLFLGGFVAGMAVIMNLTIFIIIFGFIYLVEVLSVIIQVTYFKKTKGKRIFRMAPIHHHYELGGMSETRIVYMFSLVTALLCMVSLMGI